MIINYIVIIMIIIIARKHTQHVHTYVYPNFIRLLCFKIPFNYYHSATDCFAFLISRNLKSCP